MGTWKALFALTGAPALKRLPCAGALVRLAPRPLPRPGLCRPGSFSQTQALAWIIVKQIQALTRTKTRQTPARQGQKTPGRPSPGPSEERGGAYAPRPRRARAQRGTARERKPMLSTSTQTQCHLYSTPRHNPHLIRTAPLKTKWALRGHGMGPRIKSEDDEAGDTLTRTTAPWTTQSGAERRARRRICAAPAQGRPEGSVRP